MKGVGTYVTDIGSMLLWETETEDESFLVKALVHAYLHTRQRAIRYEGDRLVVFDKMSWQEVELAPYFACLIIPKVMPPALAFVGTAATLPRRVWVWGIWSNRTADGSLLSITPYDEVCTHCDTIK